MTEGNGQHVFFLAVVQLVLGKGTDLISVLNVLQARVELHCFWNEEHLVRVKQTLEKPLLVNEIASLNFVQILVVSPALLSELVIVCCEYLVSGLSLFVLFVDKPVFDLLEIVLQIVNSHLLIQHKRSFLSNLVSELPDGFASREMGRLGQF